MFYEADRKKLDDGSASCLNLVEQSLERIESRRSLNAFTYVDVEGARRAAGLVDDRRAAGDVRPFDGLILAVKDTICARDLPLTCASALLDGFIAEFDATVVARLREQGAIVIGKTNCDEFGMGSSSEYSIFGPVRNPLDSELTAGGSSGGSAAAVAAGLCHAALGSDTGGSVRQPAGFCGVAGLRPTYSRVSRYGLTAFASSMDTIGFIAVDPVLAGRLQAAAEGPDGRDAICTEPVRKDAPLPDPRSVGIAGLADPPAGTLPDTGSTGRAAIRHALHHVSDALAADGLDVRGASLPGFTTGVGVYHALASVEAASNLARYDGVRYGRPVSKAGARSDFGFFDAVTRSRSEGFGDEVRRRVLLGTWLSSREDSAARLDRARRMRARVASDFDSLFKRVDVLIAPTTGTSPFRLGTFADRPTSMYDQDVWTIPAALAGCPAISIPVPPPDGHGARTRSDADTWPPGIQILAPRHTDDMLVRFADRLQSLLG